MTRALPLAQRRLRHRQGKPHLRFGARHWRAAARQADGAPDFSILIRRGVPGWTDGNEHDNQQEKVAMNELETMIMLVLAGFLLLTIGYAKRDQTLGVVGILLGILIMFSTLAYKLYLELWA
ncbi:MAG: hypothetical protein ACK561_09995 [Pseudomonadaceae bacterium]